MRGANIKYFYTVSLERGIVPTKKVHFLHGHVKNGLNPLTNPWTKLLIIGSSPYCSDASKLSGKQQFFQRFPPYSGNCKSSTAGRTICTYGSFMAHLTQTLSRCMHVHTVHSQDGGQLVTLHVWKENNWDSKPSPKAALLCGARFLPIYYLAVYVHTLDPFIWYSRA